MSALTAAPSMYRPSATQPRLRLTARGRAVLLTLATAPLVIAAVIMGLSGGNAQASLGDSSVTFTYVTVGPGNRSGRSRERSRRTQTRARSSPTSSRSISCGSADVEAGQRIAIPTEYAH